MPSCNLHAAARAIPKNVMLKIKDGSTIRHGWDNLKKSVFGPWRCNVLTRKINIKYCLCVRTMLWKESYRNTVSNLLHIKNFMLATSMLTCVGKLISQALQQGIEQVQQYSYIHFRPLHWDWVDSFTHQPQYPYKNSLITHWWKLQHIVKNPYFCSKMIPICILLMLKEGKSDENLYGLLPMLISQGLCKWRLGLGLTTHTNVGLELG